MFLKLNKSTLNKPSLHACVLFCKMPLHICFWCSLTRKGLVFALHLKFCGDRTLKCSHWVQVQCGSLYAWMKPIYPAIWWTREISNYTSYHKLCRFFKRPLLTLGLVFLVCFRYYVQFSYYHYALDFAVEWLLLCIFHMSVRVSTTLILFN